ncbi:MAG: hypothetical protein FJ272_07990, partial [Planctomycetes bacterium]|nr:hypothetical protein [Planctomycetota bacterium]
MMTATGAICLSAPQPQTVPIAHVGYIRADAQPEANPCSTFGTTDSVAWDYGNRSLVIEFDQPALVTRIVVSSDLKTPYEPHLSRDTVKVYTSRDNRAYVRYEKPFSFRLSRSKQPGKIWELEISGLSVLTKFLKLKQSYDAADYGFGISKLKEAVQAFSDNPLGGPVSLDGLFVEPAQPTGRVVVFVLIQAPKLEGLRLHVEAENAETWERISSAETVTPGQWSQVTLNSEKLTQGGYWLRARLVYGEAILAQKDAAFRVHSEVIRDAGDGLREPVPGGALILRDLPRWCEGGEGFTYRLTGPMARECRGLALDKGATLTLKPPATGEYAVYVALDNPWPNVKVKWGSYGATVLATQSDWP